MKKTFQIASMFFCLALLLFGTTQAGTIADEDFETYTVGGGLNGGAAGTGWEANWDTHSNATIAEYTINYPMLIDGVSYSGGANAVKCTSNADDFVEREFDSQSDTVYFSVLAQRQNSVNDMLLQFQISDNSPANNNNLGGFAFYTNRIDSRFHYAHPTTGATTVAGESVDYSSDTAFVIVKVSKSGTYGTNYDTVEMFINPTSSIEPATADAGSGGNFDMGTSTLSYFALRSYYLSSTNYAYFDDVRVGTDFASVLPTAVPEPSAVTMLLALGLALPMMLRRKMK